MFASAAHGVLYWSADTNRGTTVFPTLDIGEPGGTISVAPDPLGQQGNVYRFYVPDETNGFGKERTESSGTQTNGGAFLPAYNGEYYIGWRAMWNPMPINPGWVALFQMHGYGVTGQGAPLVLRCVNGDGNIYLQANANGVDTNFWHMPFHTNLWQGFVLHVLLSTNPAVGYAELWVNGVQQTFNNGQTRWYSPTWDNVDGLWQDSYNKLKWGCYRSGAMDGKGPATAYMSGAKVGSTYADVDPGIGVGDFSITTTPAAQSVAPGGGVNYTVSIGAISGFNTNVNLSASGLPPGASVGFSPAIVTNSGNSTLSITTSVSTPLGSYPITIIGTSGTLAHTNTVSLIVSGFSLSASPPSQTLNAGNSTNFTITVTTNASFSGSVAFGISGLPGGALATFAPSTLSDSDNSTLTISTTTNVPSANYPLTIFATNGSFTVTSVVSLSVVGFQANPGTLVWTNGAVDSNWSSILNWTNITGGGFGPPGISNGVLFTNYSTVKASALTAPGSGVVVPANINSVIGTSVGIIGLTNFANAVNTSPVYHNIGVANGATLSLANNLQVGGAGTFDFGANNTVNLSISGAGATLQIANGGVIVSQGSGSSGAHDATLDLSGLDNFVLSGSTIKMGVENVTRAGGILYLAKTNVITLFNSGYVNTDGSGSPYSGNPALVLGHNKTAVGNGAQMYLGISNVIATDYATIGRGDANDLLKFNPAFLAYIPSVYICGTNGSSSLVGVYVVGDNSPGEGSSTSNTNDFSGGTVNAQINYLAVGRGREGASDTTTCSAYLTFDTGSINANSLAIGFLYPTGSNSFANGTVNVNGSGTLTVFTNITLANRPATGGSGSVQGTLNINGGTVEATNISGAGGTSTINLNSGTLDLQPGWASAAGLIANVTTLNVGASGGGDPALLTGAAQVTTANALTIGPNGTIIGNTIFSAPSLVINGTVSPGNSSAGTMTNSGSMTFGAGGNFAVTVDDALAGPAAGWSLLQAGGSINVQSTAGNPFVIAVQTAADPAANFDQKNNYDWVIATASGGISNFSPANFIIDSSLFGNLIGSGSFYLHTNGNSLVLSFTNNLAPVTPVVINIQASGTNLVFSGTNGNAGAPYYVLTSTNLELPPTQWTITSTNYFDGSGNFDFTNFVNPTAPLMFYRLQLQ
jgi:hypothetical protein